MLYLYGIIDGCEPPERMPLGLEGRAACILPCNGFAALTGSLQLGQPLASEVCIREHLRVLEAFMAEDTVLPARFGTVFAGLRELKAHLALAHDVYVADLRSLRGQIELGVRAATRLAAPAGAHESPEVFAATEPGPGARYLAEKHAKAMHRIARQRQAEHLAKITLAPLTSCSTRMVWRAVPANPDKLEVSMAFLLSRERLGDFREALTALHLSEPDLAILCTGPWPPYSFVSSIGQSGGIFDAGHKNLATL